MRDVAASQTFHPTLLDMRTPPILHRCILRREATENYAAWMQHAAWDHMWWGTPQGYRVEWPFWLEVRFAWHPACSPIAPSPPQK